MRRIGDFWQWLGLSGEALGTSRIARRTLRYCYAVAVVVVGAVATIDGITISHEQPQYGLAAMIIWEGSSWLTFILFLWIAWIAYRIAPLAARPRWKLLVHIPAALLFSLAHVAGFVGLRKFVYWLGGAQYDFGAFFPNFRYEFAKDALGYVLFIAAFALVEHLVRQQSLIDAPGTDAHLRHPRWRQTRPRAAGSNPRRRLGGKLCRVHTRRWAQAPDALAAFGAGERARSARLRPHTSLVVGKPWTNDGAQTGRIGRLQGGIGKRHRAALAPIPGDAREIAQRLTPRL